MSERRHDVRYNTIINLSGSLLPAFASIVTVPLYLRLVGEARYGVLAILWLLLGYFSVFDLGLGRATSNQMAKINQDTTRNGRALFWTACTVNIILGVLGGLLLFVLGNFLLNNALKIPLELQGEAQSTLPWVAISVPLVTVSSVLVGTLEGQERFLITNIVGVLSNVLFQCVPIIVALYGLVELKWLVASVVIIRAISTIALFLFCWIYVPLRSRLELNYSYVGVLLRYGGWVSVTGLISPILTALDRFVIGAQVGVQVLVFYTVPYNLINQMSTLPASLSRSLFPRFSMLPKDQAQEMGRLATLVLAAIITPVIVGVMITLKPLLVIWLGNEVASQASPIGLILLIGFWFNSLAFVPYTLLQGQGRPDVVAKFHIIELPIFLCILWFGLAFFGLQGAAYAWSLRVAIDAVLLYSASRLNIKDLGMLAPGIVLVTITCISMVLVEDRQALRFGLGALYLAATFLWSWYIAPQEARSFVASTRRLFNNLYTYIRVSGQSK